MSLEYPDRGAHCHSCKQWSLLPMKCAHCKHLFCKDHGQKGEDHNCQDMKVVENTAFACPMCQEPLKGGNELRVKLEKAAASETASFSSALNNLVNRHIDSGECKATHSSTTTTTATNSQTANQQHASTNRAKKEQTSLCGFPRCREKIGTIQALSMVACRGCFGRKYCLKHRSHDCKQMLQIFREQRAKRWEQKKELKSKKGRGEVAVSAK